MATLEWGDTFDHYFWISTATGQFSGGQNPMSKKWTSTSADDDTKLISPQYARPGAAGGNGLRTNTRYVFKQLPGGALATRMVGMWWNPVSNPTGAGNIVVMFTDAVTEQCSVRTDASGHLGVYRGANLLANSTNTVSTSTWYWLEFKATIHNTAGQYELRVNGSSTNWVPQSAANQNTRNTGSNNSATGIGVGGTVYNYDDIIVADDFTGQMVGTFLRPAGPGNYTQWSANSGNNHGAVDDPSPDDDLSFTQSSTSGQIDTFAMEKLPAPGTPTILAVQHIIYARQDAGVQRTLRPKQRTSGSDYNGTSVTLTSSYIYITDVDAVDPATTSAYTKSSLESAEFGYENV